MAPGLCLLLALVAGSDPRNLVCRAAGAGNCGHGQQSWWYAGLCYASCACMTRSQLPLVYMQVQLAAPPMLLLLLARPTEPRASTGSTSFSRDGAACAASDKLHRHHAVANWSQQGALVNHAHLKRPQMRLNSSVMKPVTANAANAASTTFSSISHACL